MKKYLFIALIVLTVFSCGNYSYPEDKKLSGRNGVLKDSTASYLPLQLSFDGNDYIFDWNKDELAELNNYYLQCNEPLLYNYYLKRDIYRLLLSEKDKEPLLISINKEKDNNWIVSKRIDTQKINMQAVPDSIHIDTTEGLVSKFENYSRPLTAEEVHRFDSIFQQVDFFHLPNDQIGKNFDDFYILEAHEAGNYWCLYRSLDDNSQQSLADYMRSLTGF